MDLSCRCGARFRSLIAEARHRHNFPALCRRAPTRYKCTGCGHRTTNPRANLENLQRKGHVSCCPERNMQPITKSAPEYAKLVSGDPDHRFGPSDKPRWNECPGKDKASS